MRLLTNLLFKASVSSMILTTPAMLDGRTNAGGTLLDKGVAPSFASANVIKNYINRLTVWPVHAYMDRAAMVDGFSGVAGRTEVAAAAVRDAGVAAVRDAGVAGTAVVGSAVAGSKVAGTAVAGSKVAGTAVAGSKVAGTALMGSKVEASAVAADEVVSRKMVVAGERVVARKMVVAGLRAAGNTLALAERRSNSRSVASAKALELRRVIRESAILYAAIGLDKAGLGEEAFEYAWRGYHNLVKKGYIKRKSVLSIADFSQSSSEKRMYVIDVRHKRLLYRTYVAHGQNSGQEFADSFSNQPESFKSSLGFYVTRTTYIGRNGLSLRLNGVDVGYNDKAMKRNIVLHGCSYVGDQYLQSFGATGTSLGCPALPSGISTPIIRAVKNGSCFFIYHPTPDYLDHSVVINQ